MNEDAHDPVSHWTLEELDSLLTEAIEEHGIKMENDIDIAGIKFTIRSIDHGETERVMRSTRDLAHDVITREIVNQKRLLAASTSKINGRPAQEKVVSDFLERCPPPIVSAFYSAFVQLRWLQDNRIAGVATELGKGQASTTSESSGNSVSE